MLSLPGALLFGNLHIIFIIFSADSAMPTRGATVDHTRAHRQLTDNALMSMFSMSAPASLMYDRASVPLMFERALTPMMFDMTAAINNVPTSQPIWILSDLSRTVLGMTALPAYYPMHTVDGHTLAMNNPQFLIMTGDQQNSVMPLYTVQPAAAVVPTAVHTSHASTSDAYAHQAPPGAFIIHTRQGPMVSFPVGTYPG